MTEYMCGDCDLLDDKLQFCKKYNMYLAVNQWDCPSKCEQCREENS